ncbi:hypothetical protein BDZ91DRAFT_786825 [Kalaharituber pfeilii]|nr:hypothetical protein BDZ91DRAFT_786825 [Kalaharituber pfeilii]
MKQAVPAKFHLLTTRIHLQLSCNEPDLIKKSLSLYPMHGCIILAGSYLCRIRIADAKNFTQVAIPSRNPKSLAKSMLQNPSNECLLQMVQVTQDESVAAVSLHLSLSASVIEYLLVAPNARSAGHQKEEPQYLARKTLMYPTRLFLPVY